jgi:hypothetical protein
MLKAIMVQELIVATIMYTEREREHTFIGSFDVNLTSAESQKSLVF